MYIYNIYFCRAPSSEAMDWVGIGARAHGGEAFTRRHSCSDMPSSPRRGASGEASKDTSDDTMAARAKLMRMQAQAQHQHQNVIQHASNVAPPPSVRAEVKPNNALSTEPRSPTPHPRHGLFVDRDGQVRAMLPDTKQQQQGQQQKDKENMNPQQQQTRRQSSEAGELITLLYCCTRLHTTL